MFRSKDLIIIILIVIIIIYIQKQRLCLVCTKQAIKNDYNLFFVLFGTDFFKIKCRF